MAATLNVKQTDSGRYVNDTILINGSAMNLTGAQVYMCFQGGAENLATILSPTAGTVQYLFTSTDLANAGRFNLEWKIVMSNGLIIRTPDKNYFTLNVVANLGP